MRTVALAVLAALGLTISSATAEPWVDPAGRLVLEAPRGWRVQPQNAEGQTAVLIFNPTSDCYIFSLVNSASASATANAARNTTTQLAPEAWVRATQGLRDFFPEGPPQVVSQSVDTSGFWPVQRAELRGASKTAFGALQIRPGVELLAVCSGASSATPYEAIFSSLGHPNDAVWRAEAEQQAAARAAQ